MSKKIKAFSLFELLVVILLISIVMGLFVADFTLYDRPKKLTIQNLKSELISKYPDKYIRIICNKDTDCSIFVNNEEVNTTKIFDEIPKVYKFDVEANLVEYKYLVENRYFEYEIFPNRGSTDMIVEYKNKFYVMHSYFRGVEEFERLDNIKDRYIRTIE
jgi:hypothetical protein